MHNYPRQAMVLWLLLTVLMPMKASAGKYNKWLDIGDAAPAWKDLPGVNGEKHSLEELKDKDLIVVVFTCNSCPYAVDVEERLVALHKQLSVDGKGALVAICSNVYKDDTLEAIAARAQEKKFPFLYLHDDERASLANAFGARRTPEFFVLNKERKIVYMGAIDDSPDGKRVRTKHVERAITAVLAGKTPEVSETPPVGCLIRFPKERRAKK